MGRPKRKDGKMAKVVAKNKYNSKAYYRPSITILKDQEQLVKEYAKKIDGSVNGMINRLLMEEIPGFVPTESPFRKE